MKEKGLLKTAAFMAFAVFLSKVLGLLRDILLARFYGTTIEAIAFDTGSRLPILLFDFLIGGVITAAFIPIFNEILVQKSKEQAMRFADTYVTLITVITAALSVIGIIFAEPLVGFLAPEIPIEAKTIATSLTRIMFPMIMFTGIAFSYVGILQSLGEFRLPAIISLISNGVVVIYFLTLNSFFGIFGLAVFFVIGWMVQAFVQVPKAHKLGYRYRLSFDFGSPYIKSSLYTALPILISSCTQPLCTLINTRFASAIENGRAITDLSYANKLYIIVVGVFSFVASNLLFPMLSRASASGDKQNAKGLMVTSSKLLVFVIAPLSAGFIALSEPFIQIMYERGVFTHDDTLLTAEALRFFAFGMIFMAVNEVLTKAFFASKDTKTPMFTAIVSMLVNFSLISFLTDKLGIGGIALSSGIAAAVNCILNYVLLSRKENGIFAKSDFLNILKCVISAAIMGVLVAIIHSKLSEFHVYIDFFVSVACGMMLYILFAAILKNEEITFVFNKFKGVKNNED